MDIAIMGSSGGAGKDTVANLIRSVSKRNFEIMSLGDPIHNTADELLGRKAERKYLQEYGEAVRRIFGQDVWMKYLDRKTKEHSDKYGVIIPDIRKLIEFSHYCVEGNFKAIYVYNDAETARKRLTQRDGGYDEKSMQQGIETQLKFIEEMIKAESVINDRRYIDEIEVGGVTVSVIDNSHQLSDTREQVERWWENFGE